MRRLGGRSCEGGLEEQGGGGWGKGRIVYRRNVV